MGEIGLNLEYFYSLTPRQFDNILTGYRRKELEQVKLKYELNRDLEFAIISPYLDKDDAAAPKSAKQYKQFIWEKSPESIETRKPKTKAEQKAFWDAIDLKKETKQ